MDNIINLVNKLPMDIVNIIEEYLPKKEFVFTNKTNYELYHHLIKPNIKNYETYIRDTIKRDNVFVFEMIVRENYLKWFEIKNYTYQTYDFKNYVYFVINYCIENESNKCRNFITEFLQELGLYKNQHKKNFVKYIKWKN
jgi:hypothetical protein